MPSLNWIGKEAVEHHHKEVPYRLVHCDGELSAGDPDAGNLLVQGDNLEALKALLPYYAGQVKCIYIDPPYNTGNEGWAYNDNVASPEIKAWLGAVVGKEADDLSRHDKWLCMMYPRLNLLRDFLKPEGAIAVSIDENEISSLLMLMDEIFGRGNRVGTMVWQKGKKGDAKLLPTVHEYVVIYARNKALLTEREVKWRRRKAGADEVLAHYQAIREDLYPDHEAIRAEMMKWYRSLAKDDPRKSHKHYNWSDDRGLYFPDNFAGPDDGRDSRPRYDILHPKTQKPCKMPSTGWRWEEDTTKLALAEVPPRIHFGKTHATIPCRKSYLFEIDKEPLQSVFYKDGRAATLQVEGLLGAGAFQFPKDVDVLVDLLSVLTEDGDLILDSFAGSGSTGHAIFKMNAMGKPKRRFILVELDEKTASQKTAKRLTLAIDGYKEQVKPFRQVEPLGGGFRYCRLGVPLFNEFGDIDGDVSFPDLAAHVFFAETGAPIPAKAQAESSYLGKHGEKAVYLLYAQGLEGTPREALGNVLTPDALAALPPLPAGFEGTRIVYAEGSTVSPHRLTAEGVVFKQIPYQIAGV
ncbi:site-specific DNA-methyltransferase [Rhizobiaceae bacterium n13]|uniref:site-specific DNA-methyltransferase n=1 Tax=Ferirhizobium litorale TaxID=2927786 RepID=UPI0024B31C9B|nr:site-specific DNA-methyltransferase [Fererhizobium litorale]MDI7862957.1 site-specific DNA-methyltransferase [Fererhizobium litorale]